MKKKKFIYKIWMTISKDKLFRILSLLSMVFLVSIFLFVSLFSFYRKKISLNQSEVLKNQGTLLNLQKISIDQQNKRTSEFLEQKTFADFEEVIPFVGLLENLFLLVDSEAMISIKTPEDAIFVNHYVDYLVSVKVNDQSLLIKALDQLYHSRFITKLIDLDLNYKPTNLSDKNQLSNVELLIRLFLK